MAGSFSTSHIKFKMPELNGTVHISEPFHVTTKKSNYNVILGKVLLRELVTYTAVVSANYSQIIPK